MPYPKQTYLNKKVPRTFAISRKTLMILDEYSEHLELSTSAIVEMLLLSGMQDYIDQNIDYNQFKNK